MPYIILLPLPGGLSSGTMSRCLAEACPPPVLVDVLLIISQLARLHKVGTGHTWFGACAANTQHAQLLAMYPRCSIPACCKLRTTQYGLSVTLCFLLRSCIC